MRNKIIQMWGCIISFIVGLITLLNTPFQLLGMLILILTFILASVKVEDTK